VAPVDRLGFYRTVTLVRTDSHSNR
jgi:hypothetical protein